MNHLQAATRDTRHTHSFGVKCLRSNNFCSNNAVGFLMSQTKIVSWILSEAISVEPHKDLMCDLNDRRVHQMDYCSIPMVSHFGLKLKHSECKTLAHWEIISEVCKVADIIPQYDRIRWGNDDGMMALCTSHAWVGPIAIDLTLIMTTVDIRGPSFQILSGADTGGAIGTRSIYLKFLGPKIDHFRALFKFS